MLSEEKVAGLRSFQNLWKLNDPLWEKQRKQAWKDIPLGYQSEFSRSELRLVKIFFFEGVYEEYLPPITTFVLVPFDDEEDMEKVFRSDFYTAEDRQSIFQGGLDELHAIYPNKPDILDKFINRIMGKYWEKRVEINKATKREVEISWEPDRYILRFMGQVRSILMQKRDTNYSPYFDCLPYFYSCLENADYSELLAIEKLDKIFDVIEKLKGYPDATPNSLEVAAWLEGEKSKMYHLWPSKT